MFGVSLLPLKEKLNFLFFLKIMNVLNCANVQLITSCVKLGMLMEVFIVRSVEQGLLHNRRIVQNKQTNENEIMTAAITDSAYQQMNLKGRDGHSIQVTHPFYATKQLW